MSGTGAAGTLSRHDAWSGAVLVVQWLVRVVLCTIVLLIVSTDAMRCWEAYVPTPH